MKEEDSILRDRLSAVFLIATLAVLGLDQLSKVYVQDSFSLYESATIIPGLFSLTYVTNTGVAFGLMGGKGNAWKQYLFPAINACAMVFIVYYFRQLRAKGRWTALALGAILGGAMGNTIDRLRLGSVVDFLDFYLGRQHWPAFNIADAAITCGAIYIALSVLRHGE